MKQRITQENSQLEHKEWRVLKSLSTPKRIQDYLNTLPFDFAPGEKIDRSARGVLRSGKADCVGGAILAAAALWLQGRRPLLLDLVSTRKDFGHVVTLFEEGPKSAPGRFWGAISKTNHAVLRYREPVYKSSRELALSYFHEYFLPNGEKTLRSFSKPFDLSQHGLKWLTDKEAVIDLIDLLDRSPHIKILTPQQIKKLRKADRIEIEAGEITEYP